MSKAAQEAWLCWIPVEMEFHSEHEVCKIKRYSVKWQRRFKAKTALDEVA